MLYSAIHADSHWKIQENTQIKIHKIHKIIRLQTTQKRKPSCRYRPYCLTADYL